MPMKSYEAEDPFDNHPLFKTEEQARLEETMDGTEPAVGMTGATLPWPGEESLEHVEAGVGRGRPLGPLARLRLGRLNHWAALAAILLGSARRRSHLGAPRSGEFRNAQQPRRTSSA